MKSNNELSLTGLTLPSFDRERIQETCKKMEEREEEYKKKYSRI